MSGKPFVLKRPPGLRESDLQASLVAFFAAAVRPGDALLLAIPNGEKRDIVTAGRLGGSRRAKAAAVGITLETPNQALPDEAYLIPHGQGVLAGASDLLLLTDGGRTDYIEVKVPALGDLKQGRLSRPQKAFHAAATKLGHQCHVIYSVEGFEDILIRRQVPMRTLPFRRLYGLPAAPAKTY